MAGPAVLHIIGGNDRGKQHDLNRPETRIGRGTDQDVVLADIAVSRRHVTIVMEGQRWRLKDLGSGNGSLVNGQRMDSVVLNDGDQIEIGNTLMRFDHAASRPVSVGVPNQTSAVPPSQPGYPPPPYPGMPPPGYPPTYYPPPPGYPQPMPYGAAPPPGYAYPPGYHPPPAMGPPAYGVPPGYGQMDPSFSASAGSIGQAPSYVRPAPDGTSTGPRGLLGTPLRRFLVFGLLGFVSLSGIAAIISRSVFAQSVVPASEAEEHYRQGLRLFAAGDYDLAKTKFTEASQLAVDAPEPRRYMRLCDTELAAHTALKNAERALVNRRYAEAVRALDGVEPTSVYSDQAVRQRKDTAPKAAAEMVDEARRLSRDNPEEARSRLKLALELNPNSVDARDLLARLRTGASTPGPASPTVARVSNPPPSAATVAAVNNTPRPAARHTKEDEDGELAAVKVGKVAPAPGAPDSKSGMAAYKTRDFAAAVKAFRQDSMRQQERQAQKTLEFANQVQQLQVLVERATADEAKNSSQSMKEYEQAIQLDQRLSRGVHAAYFKQRIGGLGVSAAKQAYSQGNYELAFQSALSAQRGGGDASSILKQLEQKAGDLVQQGVSVQKANVGQAKQLWRTVLKMVPSSSPNYTKAYALLNSASAPKRDEDED